MAVATAIAIGGLAISAAGATMSFVQAGEQKTKQRQAEAKAASAMQAARAKLDQNFALQLSLNKAPYELQRDAMLSLGSQEIQAGQESERGAAPTAGKVMMAQNEAQAGITTDMGNKMTDIQKQQITEQSRLRDLNTQLDLGQIEGAQAAARDAQQAATANINQGIQGITSVAQQGLNMMPLYFKNSTPTVNENVTPYNTVNPQPAVAQIPTAQQLNPNYNPFGSNSSGVGF